MYKIVLVRHGESVWNKENRFTGWTDVDLSERGVQEAKEAGQMIRQAGLDFDYCFTSVLKRAIRTWWLTMEELDRLWLPVERSWRLNERHYGSLQGLNKTEMVEKFGEAQVKIWRRSYDVPPPALELADDRHPGRDLRYRDLAPAELPRTECLKDTVARFVPFWENSITPKIREGKRVGIFAHGNSIRALIKHLENVSEKDIVELNIPTGIPLVFELDSNLKPLKKYYLADEAKVKAAIEAVANQTKKKN